MAMLLVRTGASWSSIILLLIKKWQRTGDLPDQPDKAPGLSIRRDIWILLSDTHDLLIKSDNTQVALPNQPLLLEFPSLLQSLLYRCDHQRSSPIVSVTSSLNLQKIQTLCQSRNIYLRLCWPSCVRGGPNCLTRLWGRVFIEEDQHRRAIEYKSGPAENP